MTREKRLSKNRGSKKNSRYLMGGISNDLKPRCLLKDLGVRGSKRRKTK